MTLEGKKVGPEPRGQRRLDIPISKYSANRQIRLHKEYLLIEELLDQYIENYILIQFITCHTQD